MIFRLRTSSQNGVVSILEKRICSKKKKCGIKERDSKHIRVVLVQAAQTISNMGKTKLSRFFQRLIKGSSACSNYRCTRKLICLIYHLLINQELYQEDKCMKRRSSQDKSRQAPSFQGEHLTDRVAVIVDAFYHLNERSRKLLCMRSLTFLGIEVGQKRPSKGGG